jgi:acyl carrier protein
MAAAAGVKERVKQTIVQALKLDLEIDEIADDEVLFGDGLDADSMAVLEIVFAIEEEFDIRVEDEELRVELFDSVRTLVEYVEEKLAERGESVVAQ